MKVESFSSFKSIAFAPLAKVTPLTYADSSLVFVGLWTNLVKSTLLSVSNLSRALLVVGSSTTSVSYLGYDSGFLSIY